MQKRSNKIHFHKLTNPDVDPDDILHSHAYRKVEIKDGPSLPTVKRSSPPDDKIVFEYKNSMVGSIAQYHDKTPVRPRTPVADEKTVQDHEDIIGNRPRNSTHDTPEENDKDSVERRHHFIEPPKRNFNRFD